MIVSVAPSPALDRTLVVDGDVTPGAIHRPSAAVAVAGGKGLNVARAAHALGADVVGVAVLGGPTGETVRRLLAGAGVLTACVEGAHDTRTCTTVAAGSTSVLTEFYERATEVTPSEWAELERTVGDELDRRPGWLTVSGSMPPGAPVDAVARLTRLAHTRGAKVAVDTHGDALAAALDERPDVVKVNEHEAATVLGATSLDAAAAAQALHDRRAHGWLTVVTAGTAGAWAVAGDDTWHVAAARAGAFPVGSGDCFLAGLVVALSTSAADVPAALRLAAGAAAANAARPGAALLDPALARTLAADVDVRPA